MNSTPAEKRPGSWLTQPISRRRVLQEAGRGAVAAAAGIMGYELRGILQPNPEQRYTREQLDNNFETLHMEDFLPLYESLTRFQDTFGFTPNFPPFNDNLTTVLQTVASGKYRKRGGSGAIDTSTKEGKTLLAGVSYFRDGWGDETFPFKLENTAELPADVRTYILNSAFLQASERVSRLSVSTVETDGSLNPVDNHTNAQMKEYVRRMFGILPGVAVCLPEHVAIYSGQQDDLGYYDSSNQVIALDQDTPNFSMPPSKPNTPPVSFANTSLPADRYEQAHFVNLHEMRHAFNDRWHLPESKKYLPRKYVLGYVSTVLNELNDFMSKMSLSNWADVRQAFYGNPILAIDWPTPPDMVHIIDLEFSFATKYGLQLPLIAAPGTLTDDDTNPLFRYERLSYALLTQLDRIPPSKRKQMLKDNNVQEVLQYFSSEVAHIWVSPPIASNFNYWKMADGDQHFTQLQPDNDLSEGSRKINNAYLKAVQRGFAYTDPEANLRGQLGLPQ